MTACLTCCHQGTSSDLRISTAWSHPSLWPAPHAPGPCIFPGHLPAPKPACACPSARPGSCRSQLSHHLGRPAIVCAATKDQQRPFRTQLSPVTSYCPLSPPGDQVQALSTEHTVPCAQRGKGPPLPARGQRHSLRKVHRFLLCLRSTGDIGALGTLAEIPGLGWVLRCCLTSSELLSA